MPLMPSGQVTERVYSTAPEHTWGGQRRKWCWHTATHLLQRVREKKGHVIFNYNSRISWSIFIIFVPLETGMNTL